LQGKTIFYFKFVDENTKNLGLNKYVEHLRSLHDNGRLEGKRDISLYMPYDSNQATVKLGSVIFCLQINDTQQADLSMLGRFIYQLVGQWILDPKELSCHLGDIFKIILADHTKD
jgi:hypothetical protein